DENVQKAFAELTEAMGLYASDRETLLDDLHEFTKRYAKKRPATNDAQHEARTVFDPISERSRRLIKQIDLLYKLASRVADFGAALASDDAVSAAYERRTSAKLVKRLDEKRKAAVDQLKHASYFHRQVA